MSATTIALGIALGIAAGVLAGLFGVGGGILFVPTLVALGLGQIEAQGTSLLAILPTVLAGVWSQRRYGNFRAAHRARRRCSLRSSGSRSARGSRRRCRRTCSGGSSRCSCSRVAAQLVWRTRRTSARYPESP